MLIIEVDDINPEPHEADLARLTDKVGRPLIPRKLPSALRTFPNLVAITTRSRCMWIARPSSSLLIDAIHFGRVEQRHAALQRDVDDATAAASSRPA
ncbi:hypothetical protein HNO88_002585 [Novosphingobium chloroacetimidivorans]|uniref:Uncharacterized protein n=1 Tax=Novosphingobium chloroacetimidivorans TaxID=1428314 RepID=A0A7W7KAL8_9SPHN|nr:hypothetical protein [Novosphingobium chloroacetimidivorans]